MTQIDIDLTSPPDRENIVVQLMVEHEQLCEINQESDSLKIEIYSRQDGNPWDLDLEELLTALGNAKHRLNS